MRGRRRFLRGAVAVGAAAAAGIVTLSGCGRGRVGTGGPLGAEDLETLAVAALTLLDSPRAVAGRYRELLGWRARHFPLESRVLYELAANLSEVTVEGAFRAATPAARRRALDVALKRRAGIPVRLAPQPDPSGPDRFERYFVLPVIALYARTDAWLDAGYPDHPGMPRDPSATIAEGETP